MSGFVDEETKSDDRNSSGMKNELYPIIITSTIHLQPPKEPSQSSLLCYFLAMRWRQQNVRPLYLWIVNSNNKLSFTP